MIRPVTARMSVRRRRDVSEDGGGEPGQPRRQPRLAPVFPVTTRHSVSLYPFAVGTALPDAGPVIGLDLLTGRTVFHYDPWELYADNIITNPNILLAGVIGRGKSALAKSLAMRMTAFGVRVYVPGDPKGEWGEVATALGVEPIALGRGLPARRRRCRRYR